MFVPNYIGKYEKNRIISVDIGYCHSIMGR